MVTLGEMLGGLINLVIVVVGCLWPSYCSFKSIEKSSSLEFWLQYWTIFGLLSVLEYLLYFLVRIIPLFSVFKLAFLIWMQLPQTLGASLVYRKALQPFMRQHSQHIDKYVELGEKHVRKQMAQLGLPTRSAAGEGPVGLESVSQPINRFAPSMLPTKSEMEGELSGVGKAS